MTDRLLYLARHGDCDRGPELPDGNHDGPLTDLGRQQAAALGARLAGVPFAAVHHSTLGRAKETAHLVAEHLPGGVLVQDSDLLRECVPAVPDRADLTPGQAAFFDRFADNPSVLTAGAVQAESALERYSGTDRATPELLVTHGNLINWFAAAAVGAPPGAWMNMTHYACALTVVLFLADGPTRLVAFNDAGHLPPSMRGTDYPGAWRV